MNCLKFLNMALLMLLWFCDPSLTADGSRPVRLLVLISLLL